MKLAIMQPYLFPYIGYFQLMHAVDRFIYYDDVHYIKGGWINRNRILVNGRAAFFSVPLNHASSHSLINDTHIDLEQSGHAWNKLRKTLSQEYARAPFFTPIFALIESVFTTRADTIADLAIRSIQATATLLGLDLAAESYRSSERHTHRELKGSARVLDICAREGATQYVNLPGGRELYAAQAFQSQGIELRFIEAETPRYTQFGAEFVPALSILDVLMFNGAEATRRLVERYELSVA